MSRDTADDHRALIARLFPQLELATFQPVGGGWTCDSYEVDGSWIVQLPRTPPAAELLLAQIELLPELAREVSASIPEPELVSRDPVCLGYRKIGGRPCTEGPDGIWPERLGRFLYDLHMVPPEFVGLRSIPVAAVRDARREECDRLRATVLPLLDVAERTTADTMLTAYLDDDGLWSFATCLTHGDLGPEHVLVDGAGDLAGVIDWEETAIGDPCSDFAWWLHEMPGPGERALAAYGGVPDHAFRERARFAFALMPWYEVEHGLVSGEPVFLKSGLEGVRRRLV